MSEPLPIILATPRFVVVDKPAGVLSVPGIGPEKQDSVISRVKEMFPAATGPMMVHRLDMDTSGLLVVALEPASQKHLSRQFEKRHVGKRYEAIVADTWEAPDEGTISLPLRLDVDRRPYQIVDFVQGRSAVTQYQRIGPASGGFRVEFKPVTGRTHQLRVHAATPHLGFLGDPTRPADLSAGGLGAPILGDPLYGERGHHSRLMLHASEMTFEDPETGESIRVSAPVPF